MGCMHGLIGLSDLRTQTSVMRGLGRSSYSRGSGLYGVHPVAFTLAGGMPREEDREPRPDGDPPARTFWSRKR